jgi:general secretion pathway protein D
MRGARRITASCLLASAAALAQANDPSPKDIRSAEKYYALGVRAMGKGDAETASKNFAKAVEADPGNRQYTDDWHVAQQQAVHKLLQEADVATNEGHTQTARARLNEALAIDPQNSDVVQHIDNLEGLTAQPSDDDVSVSYAPPIELTPKPGAQSFHFRSTEQEALRRVLTAYGIRMVDDGTLGTKTIRFDVDDVDFAQAAHLLSLATNSFMVPLDPVRVMVAKESKENHEKYDRLALETIRIPGLTAAEYTDVNNVAKNVLGIQGSVVNQGAGTLTVRAPASTLAALNQTLEDLLDGKSEMLLDVKIFEIASTRTRLTGVQLPQSTTAFNLDSEVSSIISQNASLVQQIIASGLANAGDYAAIAAILVASGEVSSSILTSPFALFGGGLSLTGLVPGSGITGNLSLNSSDTRSLTHVQLRLEDNMEGTVKNGTRYPITTSSYSSITANSVSIPGISTAGLASTLAGLSTSANLAAAIPQVQYEDLGLTLKVTPRIDRNDDIVLKLTLTIQALAGGTLNGLPTLTNRNYESNIRLRAGASALVVGDLSRTESNAVSGTPGLSELPGFASLSNTTKEYDVGNIAVLVTPHVLRRRHSHLVGPLIPLEHHS